MENRKFDELTHLFLVNASQMAYIEDAPKTHAMLQKFSELYRYMIKRDKKAIFSEELKALYNYIDFQMSRYNGRFNIIIENKVENLDLLINHLVILNFVDEILSDLLSNYENYFEAQILLIKSKELLAKVLIDHDGKQEAFNLTLNEEGECIVQAANRG